MTNDRKFRSSAACPQSGESDSEGIPMCKLQPISDEANKRMRRAPLLGRLHELPRRLEHDYCLTGEVVGSGCSGPVKMAMRRYARNHVEKFAVKRYDLTNVSATTLAFVEAEAKLYLCLDHPHIARLVNVYQTPESVSLVMECMRGGQLYERVVKDNFLQEPQAAHLIKQMLLAVHYLHCHGVVHRDLKLENFVFQERGGDLLKLIDFGFSKFSKGDAKMKTCCGTESYIAPEVLTGAYTSQCDVWSLGVIMFCLLHGCMPFSGDSDTANDKIKAEEYFNQTMWAHVSADGTALMKGLLQVDPKKRPTAQEALMHPWLRGHTKEIIVNPGQSVVEALQQYSQAPRLRRCLLTAMGWLLSNKETEKVREEFFAIDSDFNGTISFEELRAVMVNKLFVRDDDIVNIFRALRVTHDDEIHYSEFLAAMLHTRIEICDTVLESTFRNFDKGLTGHITIEDLRVSFGNEFAGQRVEALLEEVDVLKEGRISFPEFAAYVRGNPIESQTLQLSYPLGIPPDACDEGDDYIVMHGWMMQRSKHLRRWRRRWCKLTKSTLSCYEATSRSLIDEFSIRDCSAIVENPRGTRQKHAFTLHVASGRAVYFSCAGLKSKSQWCMLLLRCISSAA